MADSLTATIMAARMNSPSLPLFSPLVSPLSLPPFSISFYLSFDPLFFFLSSWTDLSFSFFPRLHMYPHMSSHAKYTPPSSGRCSLSSSSSLPLPMPSTPGLSLRFQQWRLHKSRYNAEMDQWEWPRPTQGKRDTPRLYRCIHRCAYVAGAQACMCEGRIGEHAANTANHRPSGVDTNKIRHVCDNEPCLRVYQQLENEIVDVVPQSGEDRNFSCLNTWASFLISLLCRYIDPHISVWCSNQVEKY